MKPSLYLETTIPSYLVSRPSRDLIVAARQEITRQWWARRREDFRIFVSQVVIDEAIQGDREASQLRLAVVVAFPPLDINSEVISLTEAILRSKVLPKKAARDAAHIALAAVHEIDFLLTWNCGHLANAEIFEDVQAICRSAGRKCPVICTPEELLGGELMTHSQTMTVDPIVEEVREVKRRLAARFDYDATKMLKDAQRRQAHGKRKVVTASAGLSGTSESAPPTTSLSPVRVRPRKATAYKTPRH